MTDEPFRTIIEPFRIHSVEPMRLTTQAERAAARPRCGVRSTVTTFRPRAPRWFIPTCSPLMTPMA